MLNHYMILFICLVATKQFTANAFSLSSQPISTEYSNKASPCFVYTHLECNGQLWRFTSRDTSLSVVVDPLASQLDFGIPLGYRANKKILSEQATIDLIRKADPSHCLLTMGLDDHTHSPTIRRLRETNPNMRYVVAPSAERKLLDSGVDASMISVLRHGQSYDFMQGASVTATPGALVGPPWQMRENGFLLQFYGNGIQDNDNLSIYYEPHNDVVLGDIQKMKIQADIVVMPITKQSLPAQFPAMTQFTLVYGAERALEIAETLRAKVIIPLGNGVLDTDGPLAQMIQASGDVHEFELLLNDRNESEIELRKKQAKVMRLEQADPGFELTIELH
jgi:L-ascorbate metabolism protein UlaG (beta-lactamase superfamily)